MKAFTLIETLVTTAILVPALVCVAFLFALSTGANWNNQQRTASTRLLSEKMEMLQSAGLNSAAWNPGTYSDYVSIGVDGAVVVSGSDDGAPYLRVWQIAGTVPRTATVIVYAQRAGLTRKPMEIARGTMLNAR